MNDESQSLWPYSPRAALLSVFLILVFLIVLILITRQAVNWPGENSESTVLLGILILSLVPLLLLLIDMLIRNRAVLEYKGIKINFSSTTMARLSTTVVSTNIAVPSEAISNSSSPMILDALRNATINEVVVLDSEEGKAWWETRLLVLLSGAQRLGRPRIVVFLATEGGKTDIFQGWGYTTDLHRVLLRSDTQYPSIYYSVRAAASQWEHIEPPIHGELPSMTSLHGLALNNSGMAFQNNLPNPFSAEQLLASELGEKIESRRLQKMISCVRLKDLFLPVLRTNSVNLNSSAEEQLKQFSSDDSDYVAVTKDGKYEQMLRKLTVVSAMVSSLVGKQET